LNKVDDLFLARALHVAAVAAWFGGLWFVTLVVLPTIGRHEAPQNRVRAFHRIEGRFAPQASLWLLLTGASGFWLVWRMDLWWRFADPAAWWMWAMLLLWALFGIILFIAEPLFIHPRLRQPDPQGRWHRRLQLMHIILSLAGLVTITGAVAGAHGWAP
jgi:putative copper export protein